MVFKKVIFNKGNSFIAPSWEQMGVLCFNLAKLINKSGNRYDRVVALAKGGWTWARALVDYLGIEELDSVRVKMYEGIGKRMDKPQIVQPLTSSILGERILVFDDVADTGSTVEAAKDYLKREGAKSVDTATLFFKPTSQIEPDFFIHKTDAWIVFPHEIREFIEETGRAWIKKGLTKTAIKERYKKLQLPSDQVDYFVSRLES